MIAAVMNNPPSWWDTYGPAMLIAALFVGWCLGAIYWYSMGTGMGRRRLEKQEHEAWMEHLSSWKPRCGAWSEPTGGYQCELPPGHLGEHVKHVEIRKPIAWDVMESGVARWPNTQPLKAVVGDAD